MSGVVSFDIARTDFVGPGMVTDIGGNERLSLANRWVVVDVAGSERQSLTSRVVVADVERYERMQLEGQDFACDSEVTAGWWYAYSSDGTGTFGE